MQTIRIALASLILTAAASAAQIRSNDTSSGLDNGPGSDARGNHGASSHTGQLLAAVHRNSPAASPFAVGRPSWATDVGAPQSWLEGITISHYDARLRASLKQNGGKQGTLRGAQRNLEVLANNPNRAQSKVPASPISSAALPVSDSGGGLALLGLSVVGLGGARRLLLRRSC